MAILLIPAMKDTALLDEGNGRLEVLSHAKVEHDAGKPPPAGIINGKHKTYTDELRQDHN